MSIRRRVIGGCFIPILVGIIVFGLTAPFFYSFGVASESQACSFLFDYFPGFVASSRGSDLGTVIDRINASYMGSEKEVRYEVEFWYPNVMGSRLIEISANGGSVKVSEPTFFLGRDERGGFVEVLDSYGNSVLYYWLPTKTVKRLVDPNSNELLIPDIRDIEFAIREKGTILYWIDLTVAEEFLGSSVRIPSNLELPGLPFGSKARLQVPGVIRSWIS